MKIKKFNLEKQLLRYKIQRYFQKKGISNLLLLLISVLMITFFLFEEKFIEVSPLFIFFTGVTMMIGSLESFIRDVIKYFVKNK